MQQLFNKRINIDQSLNERRWRTLKVDTLQKSFDVEEDGERPFSIAVKP